MQTIYTKKQQAEFFNGKHQLRTLVHKWSTRGYGNSKILNGAGNILGKAGGCGYDRYGTALGNAIMELFPEAVAKLAKRECRGKRRNYKQASNFYGLFYDSLNDKAWIDGGCGSDCVRKILNKIGFSLEYVGDSERSQNGETFYRLMPLTTHDRKYG